MAATPTVTGPVSLPRRPATIQPRRRRSSSQHSVLTKAVLMSNIKPLGPDAAISNRSDLKLAARPSSAAAVITSAPDGPRSVPLPKGTPTPHSDLKPLTTQRPHHGSATARDGVGIALSDTPAPSAPGSPRTGPPVRQNSLTSTPRIRPTTLDIPGLTKSKVSPDGKIAQRDVGSKLIIVMVGLPARGKSYITKKMTRYLNWLQHDTKIFNVGEKRRVAASGHGHRLSSTTLEKTETGGLPDARSHNTLPQIAAEILINGESTGQDGLAPLSLPEAAQPHHQPTVDRRQAPLVQVSSTEDESPEAMDQSASFFDPTNKQAAQLREQCAMETLDDVLDYILVGNGSVGIFDATNSTLARRKQIMERIRERAGSELNVLFVESMCKDQNLLESNMRLKLSGPDYEGKDPIAALEDFRKRVANYEKNYVPLGDYEEENNMSYVKMIDVGRKMISHQIKGFLAGQAVFYLLNFNLAPRMIWISRHGESMDNVAGKIGGDSDLSENGKKYVKAMTRFIDQQRKEWEVHQVDKKAKTHFPPMAGDDTPPNPYYNIEHEAKNFCVWSSMLKRSIQSVQCFCEEDYEVKQMRMLDELNAGSMEGLTYDEIRTRHADEYALRRKDKLAYRYPGNGGEGYLDIINRVRPVIVELERMTDHCLIVTHRSVARVLLAYFQSLRREDVADLDCPLGMLYQMEPKPYGVEFKAWRYNADTDDFDLLPDYKLRRAHTQTTA